MHKSEQQCLPVTSWKGLINYITREGGELLCNPSSFPAVKRTSASSGGSKSNSCHHWHPLITAPVLQLLPSIRKKKKKALAVLWMDGFEFECVYSHPYCKSRSWSSYFGRYFGVEAFSVAWDFLAPASVIPIQPCSQHSKYPRDVALCVIFDCTDSLKSGFSYLQLEIHIYWTFWTSFALVFATQCGGQDDSFIFAFVRPPSATRCGLSQRGKTATLCTFFQIS